MFAVANAICSLVLQRHQYFAQFSALLQFSLLNFWVVVVFVCCSVVNGALEYLARDLEIAEDTVLQGMFISHPFWLPDQTASSSSAERNLYLCV